MDIVQIVSDFGFPVVMVVGLGYFVYFVWQTVTNVIDPAVQEMKLSGLYPSVSPGIYLTVFNKVLCSGYTI